MSVQALIVYSSVKTMGCDLPCSYWGGTSNIYMYFYVYEEIYLNKFDRVKKTSEWILITGEKGLHAL